MNQHQIIAAMHRVVDNNQQFTTWTVSTPHLVMLVNKLLEEEREVIAQLVEQMGMDDYGTLAIAAAIRKRTQS